MKNFYFKLIIFLQTTICISNSKKKIIIIDIMNQNFFTILIFVNEYSFKNIMVQ